MRWTSIYSVVDSTFTSIAHRLTLRSLLSSIHNFQPTQQINSVNFNNFSCRDLGITELTFLRDGVKNPLEKTTLVDVKSITEVLDQRGTTQAELLNEAQSAYRNPRDINYSQVIPENLIGKNAQRSGHYHMGVNYDPSSGSGMDVAGVISYDIKAKIEDITTPTPAGTEPYAMYSFYLDKQNLLVTPQGIASV